MNKKILIVAALLMVVCVGGAFAWGIGIQGGGGYPPYGSLALTFKLDSVPFVFATNFTFDSGFGIGLTGDYWFLNDNIVGPLNWFLGAGFGVSMGFQDPFSFGLEARLPVGLNMYFLDGFIEPYIQAVPSVRLRILPEIGKEFPKDFLGFAGNIGIRFWF